MAPYDSKLNVGEVDDTIDLTDQRAVKPPTTTDDVTTRTGDVEVESGEYKTQIIWSVLLKFIIFHTCAVYGMILIPSAKYQTMLWSK